MASIAQQDGKAIGAGMPWRWGPKSLLSGLADDMRGRGARLVGRRSMRELPDHLLKDMGISRSQVGAAPETEAADILRRAGEWR